MIVCKFGGTSVQDAEAMKRLARIIDARRKKRPVVVASAMGKTTNQLLEAAQTAAKGKRQEALDLLARIKEKHLREAQKLGIAVSEDWVFEILQAYFKEMRDLVQGLAELGNSRPASWMQWPVTASGSPPQFSLQLWRITGSRRS
jgi:aspartate kinase